MNTINGEELRDLFPGEAWQSHFAALSDSLGFSLSVYAASGAPLYLPSIEPPFCKELRGSSSEFKLQCESNCKAFVQNALATGTPLVFSCYAKVTSFALPIEYGREKAVVLGRGSFASYDDLRECMEMVNAAGVELTSVLTSLVFRPREQAEKVCGFVADVVSRLLKNSRETILLKKKFEDLKGVLGSWGSASQERPENLYRDMICKLSSLLEIEDMAVLLLDRDQGIFTSLSSAIKTQRPSEAVAINRQDPVIRQLLFGKPFVVAAEPVNDPHAGLLNGMGGLYYFPVFINRQLEALVRISDVVLKEGDRQIISTFCQQTALAVENRRLHEDLHKKISRFAALADVTKTLAPIQNHELLLETILEKSAELLKAERGSLMLLDEQTNALLLEAKKGEIEGVKQKMKISRGEGIAGRVIEEGEPLLVEDVERDPRTCQKNRGHYKTSSFVSVPLKIEGRVIGVLNLSDKTTGEVFNSEDLKLIQSFATHATVVMERNQLHRKSESLRKMTITDSLTGLLNRAHLNERLKEELTRSRRQKHALSLLMLDVDDFKYCNDAFGHLFGDKALKSLAKTLLNAVRSIDLVARFGGDEFLIILPETQETAALDIAERLRVSIAQQPLLHEDAAGDRGHFITTSIGIASYPQHGDTMELLLENVDKALYRAKNNGKNTVEVFH